MRAPPRARLADVGLDQDHGTAAPLDVDAGRLERGALAADQDDVGSGLRHGERHLAPEAPAAAGHEAALPVETEAVEHRHGPATAAGP